jgi:hypothetical protein
VQKKKGKGGSRCETLVTLFSATIWQTRFRFGSHHGIKRAKLARFRSYETIAVITKSRQDIEKRFFLQFHKLSKTGQNRDLFATKITNTPHPLPKI